MVNSKLVHLHRRSTQQKWEHEYGKGEARKCPRATLRVRAPAACHPNTNSRRLWQTTPRRKRPRGSWWRWHGPAFGADGRCTQSRKACGRSGRAKSPRLICQLWSGRPQDIAAATPLSRSLHGQQSAAAPPQPARALKLTDLSPRLLVYGRAARPRPTLQLLPPEGLYLTGWPSLSDTFLSPGPPGFSVGGKYFPMRGFLLPIYLLSAFHISRNFSRKQVVFEGALGFGRDLEPHPRFPGRRRNTSRPEKEP